MITLPDIVKAFAQGLKTADSNEPKYKNYQAGIGPFPEHKAIALIIQELKKLLLSVFATVQKIRSSLAEWHIGSLGSES
jgi:hypothetical protein